MIYIIAGHHNNDPGAVAQQSTGIIKEADLTKELRDLVIHYLKNIEGVTDIRKDKDDQDLNQLLASLESEITIDDLLIDIHFNAFNGKATGTEVIIPKLNSTLERTLSALIAEHVSEIMGIPNRGVKTEDKTARGRIAILKGKGDRLLIEVCFLDNPKDFTYYTTNKHIIAAKIAELINDNYVKNIVGMG